MESDSFWIFLIFCLLLLWSSVVGLVAGGLVAVEGEAFWLFFFLFLVSTIFFPFFFLVLYCT